MKLIKNIKLLALLPVLVFTYAACDDDPPQPPVQNEQEIITNVKLVLTPQGSGLGVNYMWSDSDGVGGKPPVFDTMVLATNKTYDGEIYLYNVTTVPTDSLNEEIEEEKNSHQFFYTLGGPANSYTTISRLDTDNNGLPVGLKFRIVTTTASKGKLNIRLSHYAGVVKTANPGGDTDLDIDIPLKIQ